MVFVVPGKDFLYLPSPRELIALFFNTKSRFPRQTPMATVGHRIEHTLLRQLRRTAKWGHTEGSE